MKRNAYITPQTTVAHITADTIMLDSSPTGFSRDGGMGTKSRYADPEEENGWEDGLW